jgi:hypothetical protein
MSHNSTPPATTPAVISKAKESFKIWTEIHKDFPRTEKFGLGRKIDTLYISLLEQLYATSYQRIEEKILGLEKSSAILDRLRFFLQIAWEHKRISTEKYSALSEQLGEVGRQIGGWRKGLQTKTPPQKMEEKIV